MGKHVGRVAFAALVATGLSLGGILASCSGDDASPATDDAGPASDVARKEAQAVSAEAAVACTPTLPTGYMPPTFVPPVTTDTACTPDQVQAYYDACFGSSASSAKCSPFVAANGPCAQCMETPSNEAAYGAVISLANSTAVANVAGCIAKIDGDTSATGCAAKVQAAQRCQYDACGPVCPIDKSTSSAENTSFKAFTDCESAASSGDCAAENAAATCQKDAKYASCTQSTFEAYAVTYGDLLCASGSVLDAGTDAGDDASDAATDDASDAADD